MSVDKYIVRKVYEGGSYGFTTHDTFQSILTVYPKAILEGSVEVFELDVSRLEKLNLTVKLEPYERDGRP